MDIESFRIQRAVAPGLAGHRGAGGPPRRTQRDWYISGPLPGPWIGVAARMPGKTLHVALALHYLKGLEKQSRVKLTQATRKKFGVGDDAARDALRRLEQAGLVTVVLRSGLAPEVTIHDAPHTTDVNIPPQNGEQ